MGYSSKITVPIGGGGGGITSSQITALQNMTTTSIVTADEFKKLADKVAALQADIKRIEMLTGYVINEMEP